MSSALLKTSFDMKDFNDHIDDIYIDDPYLIDDNIDDSSIKIDNFHNNS
ncbi:9436_t:CDS:2 [Dentiscutata heterogama]|uniref:9436_t:CDS:1 n=1 Tax=Dentiscutata heterogama TaxID=1316150 RepID=A0ACA9JV88_9GLOM|nr:9436_t:CDS:2 [Dentiscutata heterogama]